jgi:hypothetical protein
MALTAHAGGTRDPPRGDFRHRRGKTAPARPASASRGYDTGLDRGRHVMAPADPFRRRTRRRPPHSSRSGCYGRSYARSARHDGRARSHRSAACGPLSSGPTNRRPHHRHLVCREDRSPQVNFRHHRARTCHMHVHLNCSGSGHSRMCRIQQPNRIVAATVVQPGETGTDGREGAPDTDASTAVRHPAPALPALDARRTGGGAGPTGADRRPLHPDQPTNLRRAGRCGSSSSTEDRHTHRGRRL